MIHLRLRSGRQLEAITAAWDRSPRWKYKMRKFVQQLDRLVELIALLFGYVAAASAILLTLVVTYGVTMRSLFHSPQIWTDQVASYSMLWIVFFGLAYTLSTSGHIRVDFFTRMLPLRGERQREVIVWTIGFALSILFQLGCFTNVENLVRRNTYSTVGFQIPLYWPAIPMLAGAGMFSLVMLSRLIRICVIGSAPSTTNEGGQQ
jgi:TRAP-type C4-dicarboxylate transport system permease small subunit